MCPVLYLSESVLSNYEISENLAKDETRLIVDPLIFLLNKKRSGSRVSCRTTSLSFHFDKPPVVTVYALSHLPRLYEPLTNLQPFMVKTSSKCDYFLQESNAEGSCLYCYYFL